jgi:RNA-directed DNA polymerase
VDGQTARTIEAGRGVEAFLADLRHHVQSGEFAPQPVREQMIPKSNGKMRRLGIPTDLANHEVAQAA